MGLFSTGKKARMRAADLAERTRNTRISNTVDRVNALYDSPERATQRADFLSAMRQQGNEVLGRSFADNSRQQKFAMARSGLTGGRADVDSQRRLIDTLTRGRMQVEDQAQGSFADLMGQDETSRGNLIQTAQAGLDTGSAAQRAAQQMQGSLANARARAVPGMVQGLGEDFAGAYRSAQENAARLRGLRDSGASVWG